MKHKCSIMILNRKILFNSSAVVAPAEHAIECSSSWPLEYTLSAYDL